MQIGWLVGVYGVGGACNGWGLWVWCCVDGWVSEVYGVGGVGLMVVVLCRWVGQ